MVDFLLKRSKKLDWYFFEENAKVVKKPWGKEVWLNYRKDENIGDYEKRYVFKKLYIEAGTKTSFQYHLQKVETNFLISGSVEAWFEIEPGQIDKKILTAGAIWSIPKNIKHRIVTLEDIVLLEASSPEVDDVIRIADDTLRGNGRIQSEHDE